MNGAIQPINGISDNMIIVKTYTDCQMVFLTAILIPLATSERYCFILKSKALFSIIEAVFSLRKEKTGEPMISQMYLNNEKYKSINSSQSIIPPTVNKKPIQLLSSLFSQPCKPVSIVSHSMAALADLEKKYMLKAKRMA